MSTAEGEIERLQVALSSRGKATVVAESSALCFLLCFSVVGNLMVFTAVYRNHRLRTISNIFVVALGISDILMAVFCMPFSLGTLIHGLWLYGSTFCQVRGFVSFWLGLASLQTMGLVAVNRYFCIVKPTYYPVKFTFHRTLLYIFGVWCNAFLGSTIPLFFGTSDGYGFQPGKAMCLYKVETIVPYTIFIDVVYINLPLFMIIFCYASVFKTVYKSNKVFATQANSSNQEQLRAHVKETKITKTLALVFLGYSCCWIPVSVIDVLDAINGAPVYQRELYLVGYGFLVHISSCINPFIYGATNRAFRKEYIAICKNIFLFKSSA